MRRSDRKKQQEISVSHIAFWRKVLLQTKALFKLAPRGWTPIIIFAIISTIILGMVSFLHFSVNLTDDAAVKKMVMPNTAKMSNIINGITVGTTYPVYTVVSADGSITHTAYVITMPLSISDNTTGNKITDFVVSFAILLTPEHVVEQAILARSDPVMNKEQIETFNRAILQWVNTDFSSVYTSGTTYEPLYDSVWLFPLQEALFNFRQSLYCNEHNIDPKGVDINKVLTTEEHVALPPSCRFMCTDNVGYKPSERSPDLNILFLLLDPGNADDIAGANAIIAAIPKETLRNTHVLIVTSQYSGLYERYTKLLKDIPGARHIISDESCTSRNKLSYRESPAMVLCRDSEILYRAPFGNTGAIKRLLQLLKKS